MRRRAPRPRASNLLRVRRSRLFVCPFRSPFFALGGLPHRAPPPPREQGRPLKGGYEPSRNCPLWHRPLGCRRMARFVVQGGTPLRGEITPAGNKNEALPLIAASLLTDEPVTLRNLPHIRDVRNMLEIASTLGASVVDVDRHTVRITAKELRTDELPAALAREIRPSLLFAAPLLARRGRAVLGQPGGDVIGRRRVDSHFLALGELGVALDPSQGLTVTTTGLKGADVILDEASVTATENAVLAASVAKGHTTLRNAASE